MFSLFGVLWHNRYSRALLKAIGYVVALAFLYMIIQIALSVTFG